MAELLRNPKTMAKVQAEIDRVIGQKGFVEESDISELPYLQAVVKEVFGYIQLLRYSSHGKQNQMWRF